MGRIFLFVLACLAPLAAQAASFDCAKAASKVEHIVCDNAKISALDSELAQRYRAALQALSPEGQKILRDGQRAWLRHLKLVCVEYNTGGEDYNTPAQCAQTMYTARVKEMQTAAVRIGPFLFSRVDQFHAEKSKGGGQPYELEVSYARIDGPASDAARAWNAAIAKTYGKSDYDDCAGDPGYTQTGLEVVSATQDVISAQSSSAMFCEGAAHGMYGSEGANYALTPAVHPLTASDLFAAGKPWQKVLTRHCLRTLSKKDPDGSVEVATVEKIAANPKSWTLTAQGLVVTFNPYDVLPYADGMTEVVVPWRALRPYLATTRFIPGAH